MRTSFTLVRKGSNLTDRGASLYVDVLIFSVAEFSHSKSLSRKLERLSFFNTNFF